MRRLFRAIDARFVLALAALVVVTTICWGFVQRGDQIAASEAAVASLSGQLADMSADNRRLRRQLERIDRQWKRDDQRATRERDLLLLELVRLNRWLRENGLVAPVVVSGHTAGPSRPQQSGPPRSGNGGGNASSQQSSGNGGSKGGKGGGGSAGPGKAPDHSNAGGKGKSRAPAGKPGRGKP